MHEHGTSRESLVGLRSLVGILKAFVPKFGLRSRGPLCLLRFLEVWTVLRKFRLLLSFLSPFYLPLRLSLCAVFCLISRRRRKANVEVTF